MWVITFAALCQRVPSDPRPSSTPFQSELGDVVYVEVPEVGATLSKGANLGVVESVKVRYMQG